MQDMKTRYDFDDILITPEDITTIESRSSILSERYHPALGYTGPLISAPMDSVLMPDSYGKFRFNPNFEEDLDFEGIGVCAPRGYDVNVPYTFISISLSEYHTNYRNVWGKIAENGLGEYENLFYCIDMANGHMSLLEQAVKEIKSNFPFVTLMVGNIANPLSYQRLSLAGADFIRVGIGAGAGCLTTQQTAVGYPMGSLIYECAVLGDSMENRAMIVADGGFKKYADIIKALSLGADYVMVGSLLNKTLESDSVPYLWKRVPIKSMKLASILFALKLPLYKRHRGMSTKEVQKAWGNKNLKTSEGVVRWNRVEYRLSSWVTNFRDYLRSAMSYTDSKSLLDFRNYRKFTLISGNSKSRYEK